MKIHPAMILTIVTSFILFYGCKKERAINSCTRNCKTYNLSGRFYDGISNNGFANTPIYISWKYRHFCIFCPRNEKVFSGMTDANGNFTISFDVDTAQFYNYSLELEAPKFEGYFELFPRNISKNDLEQNVFQKLLYTPSAKLKIKLHKLSNDSIVSLSLTNYWLDLSSNRYNSYSPYWVYPPSKIPMDTTIIIETIATRQTNIGLEKKINNGNQILIKDSITCNKNTANNITINY